jgi:hypothetical protein
MPRATAPASAPASLLLLLFALLPLAADALFFNVQQGQQRCFIEEMPGQTLLVATYKNPDFKPFGTPGFSDTSVAIRVLDPAGAQVLARVADTEGRIAFHSTVGGEYQLCFSTNNTRWGGSAPQKFVSRAAQMQKDARARDVRE